MVYGPTGAYLVCDVLVMYGPTGAYLVHDVLVVYGPTGAYLVHDVLVVYGPMGAYLVHDVLVVYGLQYLCFNGSMQVRIHELKHKVDVLVVVRFNHVQQLNYIPMRGEGLVGVCVCTWTVCCAVNYCAIYGRHVDRAKLNYLSFVESTADMNCFQTQTNVEGLFH